MSHSRRIPTGHSISALVMLYSELLGQIADGGDRASDAREKITHVAAVILMLDPTHDLSAIPPVTRRGQNGLFRYGEVIRSTFDVLRRADRPLTTGEIVARLFVLKGVEPSRELRAVLMNAVRCGIRLHIGKSIERDTSRRVKAWRTIR